MFAVRFAFVLFLFFLFASAMFAQTEQERMSLGLGVEFNMNSRFNFSAGATMSFDYVLPYGFATGFFIKYSHNFSDTAVIEALATLRRYFSQTPYSGFFAQADIGFFYMIENEVYQIDGEEVEINKTWPLFNIGIRGGYRLPFGNIFYVEPYARLGYPFAFGVGIMAGIKF